MRKFMFLLAAAMLFSCHENIDDRIERESREYTKRNCPAKISDEIVNDSMTYDRASRTVEYHYTVTAGDCSEMFGNKAEIDRSLRESVVNATGLKGYKEAGVNFRYVYRNKGKIVYDLTVTEKEYRR